MSEEQTPSNPPVQYVYGASPNKSSNLLTWILGGLLVVVTAVGAHYVSDARTRIEKAEKLQTAAQAEAKELAARISKGEAETQSVASQLGITEKQLSARAETLQREQSAQRATATKLAQETAEAQKQIGAVSGEVSSVKTEVASTKTDVASTKTDLAQLGTKFDSMKGDLGLQSGLIAHTRDDLDVLKHKGDRNYYEFALNKGASPQVVSTVSLQLKKADAKRGKFTLNVTSDDKTIEKKDRNMAEPIQFYSGRDHLLYELVVWTVDKNKVTGYVSTPKNAPVPVTAN